MDQFCIPGTVRASFAVYNTKEDVNRLVEGVKKHKQCYPNMASIQDIQQDIIDEFDMFEEWMGKYEHIIDLGKSLPS